MIINYNYCILCHGWSWLDFPGYPWHFGHFSLPDAHIWGTPRKQSFTSEQMRIRSDKTVLYIQIEFLHLASSLKLKGTDSSSNDFYTQKSYHQSGTWQWFSLDKLKMTAFWIILHQAVRCITVCTHDLQGVLSSMYSLYTHGYTLNSFVSYRESSVSAIVSHKTQWHSLRLQSTYKVIKLFRNFSISGVQDLKSNLIWTLDSRLDVLTAFK